MKEIFEKALKGERLSKAEAGRLLKIEENSREYYELLYTADKMSRKKYGGRGQIYAQIGIEASPCPANCAFCSLAKDVFNPINSFVLKADESRKKAESLIEAGADEIFLMTTASFDGDKFLKYGEAVREIMPKNMRLVANVGDFDLSYADRLKKAGFTGVYHIRRLGEGRDTLISPKKRVETLQSAFEAGLEIYYCVEPIGPEHSNEELLQEIFITELFDIDVMAVMKRVCVPGTALFERGEISAAKLAKICAVTFLSTLPKRAMGVHEPDELCLMAGANQIYAEVSVNPRDLSLETEKNRGLNINSAIKMLNNAGWHR